MCQSLFFKEETLAQVFSCEFCEISKNTFFTEHLWTAASKSCFGDVFSNINKTWVKLFWGHSLKY